jgi:hypothetical protein
LRVEELTSFYVEWRRRAVDVSLASFYAEPCLGCHLLEHLQSWYLLMGLLYYVLPLLDLLMIEKFED